MKMNRREFTYLTAWGGAVSMAPRTTFGAPDTKAPVLVVIQLAGGNDGLNTVVPINNDHYYNARPSIAIPSENAIKINDATGLHPSLAGLKAIYDEGQLAIVEGVGYPNPNRAHFRATEIWHTGSGSNTLEKLGWIGRYFDTYRKDAPANVGLCFGKQNPQAFASATPKGISFHDLRKVMPQTPFSDNRFAKELQATAHLIRGGSPTSVYHLSRGGFDTHINQTGSHMALMKEIGDGLQAFHTEMKAAGLADRVCVLVYSEFGRRVKENASGGTDHGVAQPVFVLGGAVKGGLYGKRPGLAPDQLTKGDPAHTTDYRSVYATLLERHLGVDSKPILLGKFDPLNFI
jgi:uncharacterized protein (DUF1501 family)